MPTPATPTHVTFQTNDGREIPVSFVQAAMDGDIPSDEDLAKVTSIHVAMPSHPAFGGQMLQLIGLGGGQPGLHKGTSDLPIGEYPVVSWARAT